MLFDGESDKPPFDPGHKPLTGVSFFFNQDVSPGEGNIQVVSNKETATYKDFTTTIYARLFRRDAI